MKIRINLAQRESRVERTVFLWGPLAILLAVVVLVRISEAAARQFVEYRNVHRSVLRYEGETHEMEATAARLSAALRQPATFTLYAQTRFLNSLIDQRKVPLSALTVQIARLLPSQVRITGLSLADSARGPIVEVSVEGTLDQVTGEFLDRLEKSPDFDAVTVLNQSFESDNQQRGLVSLTCSARYIGNPWPGIVPDEGVGRAQP